MYQISSLNWVRQTAAAFSILFTLSVSVVFAQEDFAKFDGLRAGTPEAIAAETALASKPIRSESIEKEPEPAVDDDVENDLKNEITVWGGYSPDSTTALPFAGTRDARFGIIGVKYSRRFNNSDSYNFKYTAEVYPVTVLSFPEGLSRKSEYAFGFSPFGVQLNFRPRKKIQPFVGAAGGALIYSNSIPNDLGTKFNFTADFSGGLEIRVRKNQNASFGYKLFHISNGGRGQINPSFDNNVFFAGYSFLF